MNAVVEWTSMYMYVGLKYPIILPSSIGNCDEWGLERKRKKKRSVPFGMTLAALQAYHLPPPGSIFDALFLRDKVGATKQHPTKQITRHCGSPFAVLLVWRCRASKPGSRGGSYDILCISPRTGKSGTPRSNTWGGGRRVQTLCTSFFVARIAHHFLSVLTLNSVGYLNGMRIALLFLSWSRHFITFFLAIPPSGGPACNRFFA